MGQIVPVTEEKDKCHEPWVALIGWFNYIPSCWASNMALLSLATSSIGLGRHISLLASWQWEYTSVLYKVVGEICGNDVAVPSLRTILVVGLFWELSDSVIKCLKYGPLLVATWVPRGRESSSLSKIYWYQWGFLVLHTITLSDVIYCNSSCSFHWIQG